MSYIPAQIGPPTAKQSVFNAIDEIPRTEWNRLCDLVSSPLLSYDWFRSAAAAFYNPSDITIFSVHNNFHFQAIAPFVRQTDFRVPYLSMIGADHLYEPSGLLYEHENLLYLLIQRIIQYRLPFYLKKVHFHTPLKRTISRFNRRSGIFFIRSASPSPVLIINGSWEAFYNSLKSKRRYDIRRAHKRASESGPVSFSWHRPNHNNFKLLFKEACYIEALSWKSHNGSTIGQKKPLRSFFDTFGSLCSANGKLRIGFLYINHKPAAMLIGLEEYKTFWVLKIGYNPEFSRCSPGILLMHDAIKNAHFNKLDRFEFLGADEPWIHMWLRPKNYHSYMNIAFYPFSTFGFAKFSIDLLHVLINRLYQSFPK